MSERLGYVFVAIIAAGILIVLIQVCAIVSFVIDKYRRSWLHWLNFFVCLPFAFFNSKAFPAFNFVQYIGIIAFVISIIHLVKYRKAVKA